MSEDESTNELGCCGWTHDHVRHLVYQALEKDEERRLYSLGNDRCEEGVLVLFEEGHERAKGNMYTPSLRLEIMPP